MHDYKESAAVLKLVVWLAQRRSNTCSSSSSDTLSLELLHLLLG
jgi:hypothetical protein